VLFVGDGVTFWPRPVFRTVSKAGKGIQENGGEVTNTNAYLMNDGTSR
jgi:hypothetical protein